MCVLNDIPNPPPPPTPHRKPPPHAPPPAPNCVGLELLKALFLVVCLLYVCVCCSHKPFVLMSSSTFSKFICHNLSTCSGNSVRSLSLVAPGDGPILNHSGKRLQIVNEQSFGFKCFSIKDEQQNREATLQSHHFCSFLLTLLLTPPSPSHALVELFSNCWPSEGCCGRGWEEVGEVVWWFEDDIDWLSDHKPGLGTWQNTFNYPHFNLHSSILLLHSTFRGCRLWWIYCCCMRIWLIITVHELLFMCLC